MAWYVVESFVEHPNGWVEAEEVAAFESELEAEKYAAARSMSTGKPHRYAELGEWSSCPCCGFTPDSRG